MGFIKCPRCELNYIREEEQYCPVCKREMKGESHDDPFELCSICNENPVMPGKDVCYACYKEMNQHQSGRRDDEMEDAEPTEVSLGMEDVSEMEEIELDGMAELIDWPSYGYELVGTAINGKRGLALIQEKQPDIVITDIKMPVMDGLAMIRAAQEQHVDTVFVVLSGYGDYEYTSQAMQLGIRHYILKPCDEAKILPVLEQARADKTIGKSLEAEVDLVVPHEDVFLAEMDPAALADTLLVSQVRVAEGDELSVEVRPANGCKCGRCWKVLPTVGSDAAHADLCPRCAAVVAKLPELA